MQRCGMTRWNCRPALCTWFVHVVKYVGGAKCRLSRIIFTHSLAHTSSPHHEIHLPSAWCLCRYVCFLQHTHTRSPAAHLFCKYFLSHASFESSQTIFICSRHLTETTKSQSASKLYRLLLLHSLPTRIAHNPPLTLPVQCSKRIRMRQHTRMPCTRKWRSFSHRRLLTHTSTETTRCYTIPYSRGSCAHHHHHNTINARHSFVSDKFDVCVACRPNRVVCIRAALTRIYRVISANVSVFVHHTLYTCKRRERDACVCVTTPQTHWLVNSFSPLSSICTFNQAGWK